MASHRFAPEVTSAALWLNEKAPGDDLITCVQLTPYRDEAADSLYVQANTIIPVPGVDEYVIGIGDASTKQSPVRPGASSLAQTFARNRKDEITRFLRGVADLAIGRLPPEFKPDKRSRWAARALTFATTTCGMHGRSGATGRCSTSLICIAKKSLTLTYGLLISDSEAAKL